MRTKLFSERARLLGCSSFVALAGCGIPGSKYLEFQPGLGYLPGPPTWAPADAQQIADDLVMMGVDVQQGHVARVAANLPLIVANL